MRSMWQRSENGVSILSVVVVNFASLVRGLLVSPELKTCQKAVLWSILNSKSIKTWSRVVVSGHSHSELSCTLITLNVKDRL